MADITLSLTLVRTDSQPAAFLNVLVIERARPPQPDKTYDVGQTDASGTLIKAPLRPRRTVRWFGMEFESLFDRPTLDARIGDAFGHSFTTRVLPDVPSQSVTLPEDFNRPADEPATEPLLPPGSPSKIVDSAVRSYADQWAPGYVFFIRMRGIPLADATRGFARISVNGTGGRGMTNDTILQLASMTKPITATALVAMIDDWTAIHQAVAAIGQPGAPTTVLRLVIPRAWQAPQLRYVRVPAVLVPTFADSGTAQGFLAGPLPAAVSADVRSGLQQVAQGAYASPAPVVPPGHLGLLARVLSGQPVADYGDPFLPLLLDRLGTAFHPGAGVATITVRDLLTHRTTLTVTVNGKEVDRTLDPTRHPPGAVAALTPPNEPAGGKATFDYWAFMNLMLAEPIEPTPDSHYSNHNYTLLTMVIEACTGTSFHDYATRRLFADPAFSHIRQKVVEPNLGALYYGGPGPNWTGGVQFSDYTNWPGNGGFYASASQLTDWMYKLYERIPVRLDGSDDGNVAPLVSATGHDNLFGTTGYFTLGRSTIDGGPAGARFRYQHNGGTGGNGGSVNGNLAIIVSPGGTSYAALFVANGDLDADKAFNKAVDLFFH